MGKILIIKGADFSVNAVDRIIIDDKKYVTATVNPAGSGVVNGTGRYDIGTEVSLSAVPNSGYAFKDWGDGNTNATIDVLVGETDINLIANFARSGDIPFARNNVAYYMTSNTLKGISKSNYQSTDFLGSDGTGSKIVLEEGEKIYVKAQSDANTNGCTVFITEYNTNPSIGKTVIKTYTSEQTKNGLTITADTKCEVYITNLNTLEPNPIVKYTV